MRGWKLLLFGVYVPSPLYVAVALMVLGSMQPDAHKDYWLFAPWLLLPAILYTGITVTIAAISGLVFQKVSGTPARRGWIAFGTLVVCTAAVAAAIGLKN